MRKVFWDDPYQTTLQTHVQSVQGNEVVFDETIGQESDKATVNGMSILSSRMEGITKMKKFLILSVFITNVIFCEDIMHNFFHEALDLQDKKPVVFTALSKHLFYYKMFIVKYVLEAGYIPINPFMSFDYFLLDTVDRNIIRNANNNLLKKCDYLWVFGSISDGVFAEIVMIKNENKPVRFFKVTKDLTITEVSNLLDMDFESDDLKDQAQKRFGNQGKTGDFRRFKNNKLWRDNGIAQCEQEGSIVHKKQLNDNEFDEQLRLKLTEEVEEVGRASSKKELIEELADVAEVIETLCTLHGISVQEIKNTQLKKRESRSGDFM